MAALPKSEFHHDTWKQQGTRVRIVIIEACNISVKGEECNIRMNAGECVLVLHDVRDVDSIMHIEVTEHDGCAIGGV